MRVVAAHGGEQTGNLLGQSAAGDRRLQADGAGNHHQGSPVDAARGRAQAQAAGENHGPAGQQAGIEHAHPAHGHHTDHRQGNQTGLHRPVRSLEVKAFQGLGQRKVVVDLAFIEKIVVDFQDRIVAGFDDDLLQGAGKGLAVPGKGHELILAGVDIPGEVGNLFAHRRALPGDHGFDQMVGVPLGFHGVQA